MNTAPEPSPPQNAPQPHRVMPAREVTVEDLLRGERELLIRHGEELYRLQITKNGRLLLTK